MVANCVARPTFSIIENYQGIASATRSKRIETLLMFQARILKEMAVKDGIPEEKIKEIIDNLKNRKGYCGRI
jgi:hypothetical protein